MISELRYYLIENKYVMIRLMTSMLVIIFVLFLSLFVSYITPKIVESSKYYLDEQSIYTTTSNPLAHENYGQIDTEAYYIYQSNNNYWYIETESSNIIKELGSYRFQNDQFDGAVVSKQFIQEALDLSNASDAIGISYTHSFPLKTSYFEYIEITFTIVNYYENVSTPFDIKNSGFFMTGYPGDKIFIPKIMDDSAMIQYYGNIFRFDYQPSMEMVNQIAVDNHITSDWGYVYSLESEVKELNLIYDPIIRGISTLSNALLLITFVVYIFALSLILNITKRSFDLRYLLGASKKQLSILKLIFFTILLSVIVIIAFIVNLFVLGLIALNNNISMSIIGGDIALHIILWYLLMIFGISASTLLTDKYNLSTYTR